MMLDGALRPVNEGSPANDLFLTWWINVKGLMFPLSVCKIVVSSWLCELVVHCHVLLHMETEPL